MHESRVDGPIKQIHGVEGKPGDRTTLEFTSHEHMEKWLAQYVMDRLPSRQAANAAKWNQLKILLADALQQ